MHDAQYDIPRGYIPIYNTGMTTIPADGVVAITNVDSNGVVQVATPTLDNQVDGILFNGPSVLPPGITGQGVLGFPNSASYDVLASANIAEIATGMFLGVKSGPTIQPESRRLRCRLAGTNSKVVVRPKNTLAIDVVKVTARLGAPVQSPVVWEATSGGSLVDATTYYWVITAKPLAAARRLSNEESLAVSGSKSNCRLTCDALTEPMGTKSIVAQPPVHSPDPGTLVTTVGSLVTTYNDTGPVLRPALLHHPPLRHGWPWSSPVTP